MSKEDLLAKCDEALAACLDRTKKKAEGDEPNNADSFAHAAETLCHVYSRISGRDENDDAA